VEPLLVTCYLLLLLSQRHLWLTGATEAGDALARGDLADRGAAARAGLAAAAVYPQVVAPFAVVQGLGHLLRDDRLGPEQHVAHGVVQAADLLVRELGALLVRMDAGLPEDLVRVGVADARDELVVDQ